MVVWAVYFLGPPEKAAEYSYKIEFPFPNSPNSPLVFSASCTAAPDVPGDIRFDENCFNAHRSLLDRHFERDGQMIYKLTIFRNDVEVEERQLPVKVQRRYTL